MIVWRVTFVYLIEDRKAIDTKEIKVETMVDNLTWTTTSWWSVANGVDIRESSRREQI